MVIWVGRLLYNCICMVKCMYHHAYEPTYGAIYVCSLVCKRMLVVISKFWLICMHIYVIAYVWQGSMTWIHNYKVTPSTLISQACSWVVYESMWSHNSMHVCFEVHKSMYARAHIYENWDLKRTANVLGLRWLQF